MSANVVNPVITPAYCMNITHPLTRRPRDISSSRKNDERVNFSNTGADIENDQEMSGPHTLDDIDINILELLQENSKMNLSQISSKLDVAESTVRYRIDRLEKWGVITSYIALINPRMVGLNITAIMMIKLDPQKIKEVSKGLAFFKELRHLFRTTGQFDMISVVNARDIAHLNKLMEEIKLIDGVRELIVEVATEMIKVDPTFSLRK